MSRFTLDQLPERYRREVERQLAGGKPLGQARAAEVAKTEIVSLNENTPGGPLPHPEPQRDQAPALGGPAKGEARSVQRALVRFIGFRVRPLDPDNFAGSVKDLLDGLRHAALLSGDEPWRIILETEQVKVAHFKDERTVIDITT